MPIKGEYRQLVSNANIALNMGYHADKILVLDNGQIAKFVDGVLKSTADQLTLEDVLIDGNENLDVSGMVLRDREILSTDGAIIVGIVVNHKTKEVIGGPDVQSRGVIYLKDADHIVKEIGNIIERTVEDLSLIHIFRNAFGGEYRHACAVLRCQLYGLSGRLSGTEEQSGHNLR